jgi:hypothetical protein
VKPILGILFKFTYNSESCNDRQNDPLQPEAQPHLPALSAAGGAAVHVIHDHFIAFKQCLQTDECFTYHLHTI